jgi:hypothetical protein
LFNKLLDLFWFQFLLCYQIRDSFQYAFCCFVHGCLLEHSKSCDDCDKDDDEGEDLSEYFEHCFHCVFWLQGNRALLPVIIHNDYLPSTIIFHLFHRHKKARHQGKNNKNLMAGRGED